MLLYRKEAGSSLPISEARVSFPFTLCNVEQPGPKALGQETWVQFLAGWASITGEGGDVLGLRDPANPSGTAMVPHSPA